MLPMLPTMICFGKVSTVIAPTIANRLIAYSIFIVIDKVTRKVCSKLSKKED